MALGEVWQTLTRTPWNGYDCSRFDERLSNLIRREYSSCRRTDYSFVESGGRCVFDNQCAVGLLLQL